jgi:protein CpxP
MRNSFEVKRMRAAGILLCGALLAIVPAIAQQDAPPPPPQQGDAQGPPPGGGGRGGRGGMNPERRLEMMQQQLNLTADQSTAIKAIFEDERAKMEAARASTAPDDRRAKMMAMREEEKTKIEAVLTPEQKIKYEEMEANMRNRRDTPPPPPPTQ